MLFSPKSRTSAPAFKETDTPQFESFFDDLLHFFINLRMKVILEWLNIDVQSLSFQLLYEDEIIADVQKSHANGKKMAMMWKIIFKGKLLTKI